MVRRVAPDRYDLTVAGAKFQAQAGGGSRGKLWLMGAQRPLENSRIGTSQKKEVDYIEDVFFLL